MSASSVFTLDVDRRRSVLSNQGNTKFQALSRRKQKYALLFRIPHPRRVLHNATVINENMIERFMTEKKGTREA